MCCARHVTMPNKEEEREDKSTYFPQTSSKYIEEDIRNFAMYCKRTIWFYMPCISLMKNIVRVSKAWHVCAAQIHTHTEQWNQQRRDFNADSIQNHMFPLSFRLQVFATIFFFLFFFDWWCNHFRLLSPRQFETENLAFGSNSKIKITRRKIGMAEWTLWEEKRQTVTQFLIQVINFCYPFISDYWIWRISNIHRANVNSERKDSFSIFSAKKSIFLKKRFIFSFKVNSIKSKLSRMQSQITFT